MERIRNEDISGTGSVRCFRDKVRETTSDWDQQSEIQWTHQRMPRLKVADVTRGEKKTHRLLLSLPRLHSNGGVKRMKGTLKPPWTLFSAHLTSSLSAAMSDVALNGQVWLHCSSNWRRVKRHHSRVFMFQCFHWLVRDKAIMSRPVSNRFMFLCLFFILNCSQVTALCASTGRHCCAGMLFIIIWNYLSFQGFWIVQWQKKKTNNSWSRFHSSFLFITCAFTKSNTAHRVWNANQEAQACIQKEKSRLFWITLGLFVRYSLYTFSV